MDSSTLLLYAGLPVLFLAFFIYKKDRNREPMALLVRLFFSGIGSTFITLLISFVLNLFFPNFFDESGLTFSELVVHVFLGVAFVEEFSKWFMLYRNSYLHREYDQVFDMIVYASFVSLGFAFFENILYVSQHGVRVAIISALTAVPAHFCFGIFMGYYLSMAKLADVSGDVSTRKKFIFLSLFVPSMLHGIYDFCLMSGIDILFFLFFVFVILLYIITLRRISKVSKTNRKLKYNYKFCPNCGSPVKGDICSCGSKNE